MEYEFFPKGSAIFHFGDIGRKFYLILRGSVDIYIPKSQEEIQLEVEELDKETKLSSQHLNALVPQIDEREEDAKIETLGVKKDPLKLGVGGATKQRKSVLLDAPPVGLQQPGGSTGAAMKQRKSVLLDVPPVQSGAGSTGPALKQRKSVLFDKPPVGLLQPGGGSTAASMKQRKSVLLDTPSISVQQAGATNAKESHSRQVFRTKTNLLMKATAFSKAAQMNNDLFELFSKFEDRKDIYIKNGVVTMKKVRNMGAGSYFGEVALSTDKPRSASVIAAEDVHVVSLTKDSYQSIFEKSIQALAVKAKFFETFFDNCGKELVNRIAYVFKERTYSYGQVVYSEGDPANEVFLVKQGEIQVI